MRERDCSPRRGRRPSWLLEHKPSFATRILAERRTTFLSLVARLGIAVDHYPPPRPRLTRDIDDDDVLAYALRDGADFPVSGDLDLLALADASDPPRILDPGAFVRELRDRETNAAGMMLNSTLAWPFAGNEGWINVPEHSGCP